MIRYKFSIPSNIIDKKKYCNSVLSKFKSQLLADINVEKFKLRHQYLIDNSILIYAKNPMKANSLIKFIINSFNVKLNITKTGSEAYIYINDFITVPNSNMTVTHFLRFLEYGNDVIKPYNWIRHSIHKLIEQEVIK